DGRNMLDDVKALVDISYASRAAGDRLWGRLAGGPWAEQAVDYVEQQFREAGLVDIVRVPVPFSRPEYVPTDWHLRVIGAPEFGPDSADVELQSAVPMGLRAAPAAQGT